MCNCSDLCGHSSNEVTNDDKTQNEQTNEETDPNHVAWYCDWSEMCIYFCNCQCFICCKDPDWKTKREASKRRELGFDEDDQDDDVTKKNNGELKPKLIRVGGAPSTASASASESRNNNSENDNDNNNDDDGKDALKSPIASSPRRSFQAGSLSSSPQAVQLGQSSNHSSRNRSNSSSARNSTNPSAAASPASKVLLKKAGHASIAVTSGRGNQSGSKNTKSLDNNNSKKQSSKSLNSPNIGGKLPPRPTEMGSGSINPLSSSASSVLKEKI